MNILRLLITVVSLFIGSLAFAQNADTEAYPFDPAAQPLKNGTPGEVMQREFSSSKIYPGTQRSYWIYVPAGYNPDEPACLFVSLDGVQHNAPTVFDNLIASGEMPVTIGVFVAPGEVRNAKGEVLRYNRSNEFDKTDDTFARFLLEELLPEVEQQSTADGRPIRLSKDANDRAISGCSSGAICAFTAAWFRPDAFSRVYSAIGTYVPMRGGNEYPALIRKTEPKPLRIFLEDGSQDTWNPLFGSWYESNVLMESALRFSGYEVAHSWGHGGHDGTHAALIFPDVMRWLWKGWPHRVQKGNSSNNMLPGIVLKDCEWEPVDLSFTPQGQLFATRDGGVLVQDEKHKVYQLDAEGNLSTVLTLNANESLVGSTGEHLYLADTKGNLIEAGNGKKRTIAKGLNRIESVLATEKGSIYLTQASGEDDCLWLIQPNAPKQLLNRQLNGGGYLALFPNLQLMLRSEKNSQWLYSYTVTEEGKTENGQRFYWLHNTENYDWTENGNMVFDRNGNLFIATVMGVQVCDHNGRVRAILTLPSGRISSLCFGGKELNVLYVLSGNKLYRRKVNTQGHYPWLPALNPGSQGAG